MLSLAVGMKFQKNLVLNEILVEGHLYVGSKCGVSMATHSIIFTFTERKH